MVICVCAGFGYAWSVLQTPIIAQFGWADSGVALAYTITVVCSTMAPLLFGGLIRRMSSRLCVAVGAVLFGAGLFAAGLMSQLWQLYLFYGVISGLGVGFIYPSMMAYVVRLFPDRSGMASGLGTAAYGSGAILWAPTAAVLMEKVGLGSAFRVLGVLFAAVILLGSLLLAEPPEGFHAAMAPAAYDTIQAHFRDTGRRPSDYDLIVTGDLGSLGKEILLDLFHRDGIEFKNLEDCGVLIYDAQTQDVHCGGSGCGCGSCADWDTEEGAGALELPEGGAPEAETCPPAVQAQRHITAVLSANRALHKRFVMPVNLAIGKTRRKEANKKKRRHLYRRSSLIFCFVPYPIFTIAFQRNYPYTIYTKPKLL